MPDLSLVLLLGLATAVLQAVFGGAVLFHVMQLKRQSANTNAVVNALAVTRPNRDEVLKHLDDSLYEIKRRRSSDWWHLARWRHRERQ